MVGQSVGNYRVTSLIGQGGMGAVYVAEHPGIGRRVAVKVLLPELARDQEMVTRFFNEARAANAIHHPGIVEVLDFGTLASGASYIVMELLEGESLAARMNQRGPMPVDETIEIISQAAHALGAAHAQGIIHRDLKPDNLFLIRDQQTAGRERVKVLDFGIAKLAGDPRSSGGSVKTRTGVLMGTPIYMSPEQCRGTRTIDHRSDIYALGVILYEVLCGRPPFVSEGQGELIHMHIAEPPPPPHQFNGAITPALEEVILRTLAKDPADRFQSMNELAEELRLGPTRPAPAARRPVTTPARTLAAGQPTPPRTLMLPDEGPAPGRRGTGAARAPTTTLSASTREVDRPARPTPVARRSRALPIAGGLLLIAAGGVIALFKGPLAVAPPPAPSPSAEAEPAEAPAPAPRVRAETPAPPRPEPARSVSVSLTSVPSGARLVREQDQRVVGVTPFRGSSPARNGVERLRLELDGYLEESVVLPLDQDVDLSFSLKPLAARDIKKKRRHAGAPRPGPTASSPTPASPPAPARPEANPEPVPL